MSPQGRRYRPPSRTAPVPGWLKENGDGSQAPRARSFRGAVVWAWLRVVTILSHATRGPASSRKGGGSTSKAVWQPARAWSGRGFGCGALSPLQHCSSPRAAGTGPHPPRAAGPRATPSVPRLTRRDRTARDGSVRPSRAVLFDAPYSLWAPFPTLGGPARPLPCGYGPWSKRSCQGHTPSQGATTGARRCVPPAAQRAGP